MKYRVKIYMKSGNIIDEWFTELSWTENYTKKLAWELEDVNQRMLYIDLEQIEAIVQVEAKGL